jgi:hypothetical protein
MAGHVKVIYYNWKPWKGWRKSVSSSTESYKRPYNIIIISLWSSDSSVVDDDRVLRTCLVEIELSKIGSGESRYSSKEGEFSLQYSTECEELKDEDDDDDDVDDDKKGQSCSVGVGKVLLKLSNMEEVLWSWGEVGSNMISSELLQVWWS